MAKVAQRRKFVLTVVAAVVVVVAGCSSSSNSPGSPATSGTAGGAGSRPPSGSAPAVTGTVTVLAAASLQEAFTTLGKQFEAAHPGTTVRFSFGASSDLAAQINQGAPADVFASASPKNMQQVVTGGEASSSSSFAKNVMEVAVPPKNPGHVTSVTDLAKSSVTVALCEPQVPCGAVAAQVFKNAKITVKPVTLEPDVKSTLSKVELNEVDAGMVYVTDVRAAGSKVKGVVIPNDINASTEYPIAALTKAPNPAGAQAFVKLVLSPQGQSVLTSSGFEKP
jgi:molybdate transport system substrate-binding protein